MPKLDDIPLYDTADYLDTPESISLYLEEVIAENDSALLAHALGVVARAKGMAEIATRTGRSRETLYRTLSEQGNPQLDTLFAVLAALDLRLAVKPIAAARPA